LPALLGIEASPCCPAALAIRAADAAPASLGPRNWALLHSVQTDGARARMGVLHAGVAGGVDAASFAGVKTFDAAFEGAADAANAAAGGNGTGALDLA